MAEAIYDFASYIVKFLAYGAVFLIAMQINKLAGPSMGHWITIPFGALALIATLGILRKTDRQLRQKWGYLPLEGNS
ncbi:hypothetical protein [Rhizorhabdus dicambivorans]|uniref:Uncharacterized protein n=1 Tax=Rhizorhabdus dicambivorans TaxID=1850238 RepID=A0A2A4FSR4_9SPHN|nr:hypothetical protein [Rhizorhabdus dicambivorans]ATE64639.1 hypothetical protein CMV14_09665 [Rhizorhabdus dicambivorans]PCE40760.1 hypothetical protein COO09_18775 [Rhizorhabdus dicambivorans]